MIGEPWSPLILRDVWAGFTRFEQLQADLGISRKVLTERLNHLVGHGVLERRPYDQRPRHEYHLTAKGAGRGAMSPARVRGLTVETIGRSGPDGPVQRRVRE
ncbi:winged helix-turn-helix transcriptional regulator [Nonomuraea sp. NPDC050394]|uniref:winged helix-turn-helix transcriptional regulator n=1 Tax=Nonomuraea sp. NPDC050394 TaxID=3364363 RepID=UPI0037BAEA8E